MLSNPDWTVNLLVFTLGDRGLLDEESWLENWTTLALPDKGFSTFAVTAATLAQTTTTSILECYSVALKALNAAPSAPA